MSAKQQQQQDPLPPKREQFDNMQTENDERERFMCELARRNSF